MIMYLGVDQGTPPEFQHSTKGLYRVAAKTEKEAVKLLRTKIKFGSIQVGCKTSDSFLKYKQVAKMKYNEDKNEFDLILL